MQLDSYTLALFVTLTILAWQYQKRLHTAVVVHYAVLTPNGVDLSESLQVSKLTLPTILPEDIYR